jgi:hypothetical protein
LRLADPHSNIHARTKLPMIHKPGAAQSGEDEVRS